jgi:class 3 adenylate cyclase/predicted ATPase
MRQVADWLEKLGMSEYAPRFAENGINIEALDHLTDQDLKDIGVLLGHRRIMLAAIAELGRDTATTSKSDSAVAPETKADAERRQVTVMFSDLVGSTALSARMDPEDLRDVISAYQKCVAETVRRFGGFVAKYMGDGALVYFGYPQAHEDDAERAVRAGLDLIASIGALKAAVQLQARVGIATGLVVVGDLIGSGEAAERAIVGETPNLAARLQGIAEPNVVVIADSTRGLLGNLFELKDLGQLQLKGLAGPARAFAVLRTSSVESRFEALHAGGISPLVGREEEVELIMRRWARAKDGQGQVVLISGEAGIGKSRLTAALLEGVAPEPHTRLRYFCSPQATDSALYPIIGQMERAAGFAHDDAPKGKLDKFGALLERTSTSGPEAALLAELLSLPNDGRYPALELPPPERRQRTLRALGAQVEALAGQRPVLMVFEDVHWADPTSLELFDRAVDRIANLRVLLLVTFRPEFAAPWIGRPHVTALTLNRLTQRDIDTLIDRVVGNEQLPANIRQDIIERTDGIPLFVEEMTKAVLEAEGESNAQRTAAVVPPSRVAVPASLHASLMARLDRLGPAKEIAQIGAAIGREFSYTLMAAVVKKPEAELNSALNRLVESGLLFRQGVPPHASYLFKHALVQDTAYGTLLREPRRALHARIAEALEIQFAEILENQPELLARHCTEAGLVEKAASLWGKAGQRSLARSALVESAEQLARALALIAGLPSTPALRREQIKLQVALITPLIHVRGYGAAETREAVQKAEHLIRQAEALGEPPDDPLLLFSVLFGFWVASYVAFNGRVIRELAEQFMSLAEKQISVAPRMVAHRITGISLLMTGEITKSLTHFNHAVALYDPRVHRALAARFGQDERVSSLSYRAITRWILGYPEAALADADRAVADARELGQAATLMYAFAVTFLTYFMTGSSATAVRHLDEQAALAEEKSAPFWKASANLQRSAALTVAGQAAPAIQLFAAGQAAWQSVGATMFMSYGLSFQAKAHSDLQQFDDAWRCIGEAISTAEEVLEKWWFAEVYRVAGDIALRSASPDGTTAGAYYERALAIARSQEARSFELRAAMSLARLWRDQGRRDAARDLLAPVYNWFTEGFDTSDLKEAKTLLDELA